MSDHARWRAVFVVQDFHGNPDHSSFISANGAYQHIEYVRAGARDCLRPASASFALHHAPPFVRWPAVKKPRRLRCTQSRRENRARFLCSRWKEHEPPFDVAHDSELVDLRTRITITATRREIFFTSPRPRFICFLMSSLNEIESCNIVCDLDAAYGVMVTQLRCRLGSS